MNKVHRYHFLSSVQLNGFVKLFKANAATIYANYSTTDKVLPKCGRTAHQPLHLLFVGRLVKEKGVFVLLAAFERLLKKNPSIKLTIAGDGPALSELVDVAKRLPKDAIRFAGFLTGSGLESCYKEADVLVLPTYHPEGFPYVFIEAMRAGLPVISTPEGALDYLVQDAFNGFQVCQKDVDSLEAAAVRVLDDIQMLDSMSQNCQNYFKMHLSRAAAEDFYNSLLAVG